MNLLVYNLRSLTIAFFFSPLLLIPPVVSLFANGALISVVGIDVAHSHSILLFLAGVLPHGVIEIPAFIIGEAAAMAFGFAVLKSLFGAAYRAEIGVAFTKNLRFLGIAALLLIPAAFIEAFITPLLIRA